MIPTSLNSKTTLNQQASPRERVVLHCDLNNFYATVACRMDPSLEGKAVVVCGDPHSRHGIILAKNELAKKYDVKTGDVLWQAHQKCPDLIEVAPDFPRYLEFSHQVQAIYDRYTDQIEPFGIDECWLDVTGSLGLFGSGQAIADQLRQAVRQELGLTISAGVSFNKVFAKLGSDMKKPDATTCITTANYRQLVWCLPVGDLFFVGSTTARRLNQYGIFTIGQIAQAPVQLLERLLGINGRKLWIYARGEDPSPVLRKEDLPNALTISHGLTCGQDLHTTAQAKEVLLFLAQRVTGRLRESQQLAKRLSLSWRTHDLSGANHQKPLAYPCRSAHQLTQTALELLETHWDKQQPLRSLSIQAGHLVGQDQPQQMDLWNCQAQNQREEKLEALTDSLRSRYGSHIIHPASQLLETHVPHEYQGDYAVLPGSRV